MVVFDFLDGGLLQLTGWQVVLAVLLLTHVTIAAVTIFLHRAQAHRALDLHWLPSTFFRIWLWMTTGMQTKEWVAIHRKHHAKCETPEDPHSPQTRGLRTVLWQGAELYTNEAGNAETLSRFSHGVPDDALERHVLSRFPWQGCALMLFIDVLLFGWIGFSVWGIQMMWIPFWAAGVINGIGHFWGYRNYECADASTNISPWGILVGGEELHNNHHTFPTSAKLSSKWYEFDLGWAYIRVLQACGLARVLRTAPVPRVTEPRRGIDLETLQAVIANRYDLLAKYTKELRRTYGEEVERLRVSGDERARLRALRRWLVKDDVASMPAAHQQTLKEFLEKSGVMQTVLEMRAELSAIWGRSSFSREQMLAQLQDWIARAEASGIRALQDAALRMRSYQPAAAA
jgi:stearoyl-CoA desaturase (delta-9 desaturase)